MTLAFSAGICGERFSTGAWLWLRREEVRDRHTPAVLGAGLRQLAYLAPARWGFGATASTVNLNAILLGSGKPSAARRSRTAGPPAADQCAA